MQTSVCCNTFKPNTKSYGTLQS